MKKLLPFILILLAGCQQDNAPSQHIYTVEQYNTETNVTLLPSTDMYISFETVIALHKNMQECLGLAINPETDKTVIMFRSFKDAGNWFNADTGGANPSSAEGGAWGAGYGLYMNIGGVAYVFINTDLDKEPHISQGFYRNAETDTQVVKHEFIHAINYHVLGSGSGHGDEFNRCDAHIAIEN